MQLLRFDKGISGVPALRAPGTLPLQPISQTIFSVQWGSGSETKISQATEGSRTLQQLPVYKQSVHMQVKEQELATKTVHVRHCNA